MTAVGCVETANIPEETFLKRHSWRNRNGNEELNCSGTTWGDKCEELCSQKCSWRKRGLPWKQDITVEWCKRGGTAIVNSVPTSHPLPLWALGGTCTRESAPQSVTSFCWPLPPWTLGRDPAGVNACSPVVTTLLLFQVSKHMSPSL